MIFCQLFVVLAAVVAVMLYRMAILPIVAQAVEKSGIGGNQSSTFTSLLITTTATMINLICIIILNWVRVFVFLSFSNLVLFQISLLALPYISLGILNIFPDLHVRGNMVN